MDNVKDLQDINKSIYWRNFKENFPLISKTDPSKMASKTNEQHIRKIDFDQVLFIDRYHLEEEREQDIGTKKEILENWLKDLLYSKINLPIVNKVDFLFVRSLVRDDYKELFHDIISCVNKNNSVAVIEDFKETATTMNIEASRILLEMRHLYYLFTASHPIDRACLYVRLCYYLLVMRKTMEIMSKIVVFHSDMQAVENLIAQHANQVGRITVTLQHGLYVDYGDYKTVNVVNYLQQPSEYFLSWGEDTRKTILRHHPDTKVVICGKPRINWSNFGRQPAKITNNKSSNLSENKNYFTVILDQKIFNDFNHAMVKIIKKFCLQNGLLLNLKFHPQIDKREYTQLYNNFEDGLPLDGSQFVAGHTSSLLYEAMNFGIKVVKYKSEIPCLDTPPEITFSNIKELETILNQEIDYKKLARKYITYAGLESLKKYKSFFNAIIQEAKND